MKKYVIIVECAIECDGRFLIIRRPEGKHAGGLLAFAGGKVDEADEGHVYDMLHYAVKREIFEELGLDLTGKLEYITSEHFVDDRGISAINNLFYYKYEKVPTVIPDIDEVPWYGWLTKDEILRAPNSPAWLKKLIELVIERKSQ